MMANDGFSKREFWVGQRIELEYYEGGLGIGYYTYAD